MMRRVGSEDWLHVDSGEKQGVPVKVVLIDWVVVSNILYVHPETWGRFPIALMPTHFTKFPRAPRWLNHLLGFKNSQKD